MRRKKRVKEWRRRKVKTVGGTRDMRWKKRVRKEERKERREGLVGRRIEVEERSIYRIGKGINGGRKRAR